MGCSLRHGGNECDGRSAAPNDHDAFAGVIQVLRPGLRMDDRSLEAITAAKFRRVACRSICSSRRTRTESCRSGSRLFTSIWQLCTASTFQRASLTTSRRARLGDESGCAGRCLLRAPYHEMYSGSDGHLKSTSDSPRPKRIRHGEHIRVRADARIAEQIPGAADRARFSRMTKVLLGHFGAGDGRPHAG